MSQLKLTGCLASQLAIPASRRPVPSEMGHLEKNTITYTCVKTTLTLGTVVFVFLKERTRTTNTLSKCGRCHFRSRPIAGEVDDIRFTSPELARPTTTPLRHRLLHLSEQKLDWLEPSVGNREAGTCLRKGVLVREAVRSTGRSLAQGSVEGMTDWCRRGGKAPRATGKEEEDDDDEKRLVEVQDEEGGGGRVWVEELLANMGQDEYTCDDGREVEWTESSVSKVVVRGHGRVYYPPPAVVSSAADPPGQIPVARIIDSALSSVVLTPEISLVELPLNVSADPNATEAWAKIDVTAAVESLTSLTGSIARSGPFA
ncbi:hypothetical protein JCM24511_07354 [Saitozyma sp. JCM 24511]|nr:hypothetical protein JCM24511_07354 [Saitozyma sp. JCM 24511]